MLYQYLQLSFRLLIEPKKTVKKIKGTKYSSQTILYLSVINSFILALMFFGAMIIKPKLISPNVLGNVVFIWPGVVGVIFGILKNTLEFIFAFYSWAFTLRLVTYVFRSKISYKKITQAIIHLIPSYAVYFSLNIFIPLLGVAGDVISIVMGVAYFILLIYILNIFLEWKIWKSILTIVITYFIFIIVTLTVGRVLFGSL